MAKADYERNQEMWRLRHIEGWSLPAIGKKFGVSRERVRQIIGNTGKFFRREWTEKIKSSGRYSLQHYHFSEIKHLPGVSKVWQEDWSSHRHDSKGGYVRVGQEFEELAYSILKENGIDGTLMPNRFPYSILTDKGVKIDVHVGNTNTALFKSQHNTTPTWRVPNIRYENDFDFLMAFIPEGYGYTYFVIPHEFLSSIKRTNNIRIPWPKISEDYYHSKWHQFHKRIDLIKEFPNGS